MKHMEEFKSYYEAKIVPQIKSLENRRKKRLYISVGTGLFFLFAILILYSLSYGFSIALLFAVIRGFGVYITLLSFGIYMILGKLDRSYVDYKFNVIKNIISYLGDYDYRPDSYIEECDFLRSRIFDRIADHNTSFSKCKGNDYVRGKIDDIILSFSEIDALYQRVSLVTKYRQTKDTHGNYTRKAYQDRQTSTHKLFKGLFFMASFKNKFMDEMSFLVTPLGEILDLFKAFPDGRFEKVIEPEKDNDIDKYLSSSFFELLKANNIKGNTFLSFRDNKLYIGIRLDKDLFELSATGTLLNYEDVIKYFQCVNFAVRAVKEISSRKDIWISSYETPEDKAGRGICPWCNMKDSISNNMCRNCGYKVSS